jgi:chemotaxis protein methyltransferase CheR
MPMTNTNKEISKEQLAKLSSHICKTIGLEFPENRYKDLTRGIEEACGEFGFSNANDCIEWLLHTDFNKDTWDILAGYLTIGETYFFRDSAVFKFLKDKLLHDLIYARWQSEKYLRIWSAACCTGEEPYSIAMLIDQLIPNRTGWNISIIATDINEKFLNKAKKGVYTQWSFRNTPEELRNKYFSNIHANQYSIHPKIKRMVSFSYLNLAESNYPSYSNNTNELDLICCRNVLMYFSEPIRKKVVNSLSSCLTQNGVLIISPGEADYAKKAGLLSFRSSETTVFRKEPPQKKSHTLNQTINFPIKATDPIKKIPEKTQLVPDTKPTQKQNIAPTNKQKNTYDQALQTFNKGAYNECIQLLSHMHETNKNNADNMILTARCYANLKQYETAKSWCEKAINLNRFDPGYYYLMASILQEQGEIENAIKALNQALYLEPSLIMAYVTIGMIRRKQGRKQDFQKAINNAMYYLKKMEPDDIVPLSDDNTAGRLIKILESMLVK